MSSSHDNWKTGFYGDDNDGPLLICGECGGVYPQKGEAGSNSCRCECEFTGEFRKYCDCYDCANWRYEIEMREWS